MSAAADAPPAGAVPPGPHPDAAALVRWVDGEPPLGADPLGGGVLGDGVLGGPAPHDPAACPVCAARAEVLRRRSAALGALLRATDAPAPPMPDPELVLRLAAGRAAAAEGTPGPARPARPRLALAPSALRRPAWRARPAVRLAAAGVAFAAASLAAQPVRHWVAAQWARFVGAPAAPAPARPATPAPADSAAPGAAPSTAPSVVVTFRPTPGPLTVRVDVRPATGTLRLTAGAGAGASAALGAGSEADLLVLPAGVRVRNRAAAPLDLHVTVPAGTPAVRLVFGAPAADTTVAVDARQPVLVPLGRRPAAEAARGP